MICATAQWEDKKEASAVRREVKRIYKANTSVYLCERCDRYHVQLEVGRYPVSENWQRVLICLAQGMNRHEIAAELSIPWRTVDWILDEMKKRFYALNRPHLVAIAIALGIVNPNQFVPALEEHHDPDSP